MYAVLFVFGLARMVVCSVARNYEIISAVVSKKLRVRAPRDPRKRRTITGEQERHVVLSFGVGVGLLLHM